MAAGFQMTWYRLDLMNVLSREVQVKLIKDWGRLGVRTEIG